MNDDVFDFFYEALPGYEEVGRRRILMGCWGAFNNPEHVDYDYRNMEHWGNEMFVTPGVVVDGELVTTNLVDINLGIRILLGSSYYDDWANEHTFVQKDPLGNPVDQRHPWNQTTLPHPQKRDLEGGNYSWVMSPRWFDQRTGDYLALDTGGGALARLWATALADKVKTPFVQATGSGVRIQLPKTPDTPDTELEWRIPQWSNAIERDRARVYFIAYAAAMALHFVEQGLQEVRSGNTKVFEPFEVPDEGDRLRLPRGGARRAVPPPRDPRQEDRQLPPLPADAVEREPDGLLRDAGALRGRGGRPADLRGERPGQLPRDRHHAGGPVVRPLPALRRAHVPGPGQDAEAGAHADVRGGRTVAVTEVGRVEELLERARGASRPGCPRHRARDGAGAARALRRGPRPHRRGASARAGARRLRATSSSSTCCCCTACTR